MELPIFPYIDMDIAHICPYLEMPEQDMMCRVIVIPYGDHLGDDPVNSMYGYPGIDEISAVIFIPYMEIQVMIVISMYGEIHRFAGISKHFLTSQCCDVSSSTNLLT